tara:strand:+ start:224 stop:907 length:684 start_codon:yes stop_codon:yes gene_type:complete
LSGKLYIVSTPIGNLQDITSRAITVLSTVEIIACEDTRVTRKLLNFYNIKNKLITYNDFNSLKMSEKIVDILEEGQNVALVSDAGTPCISDPGYRLVNRAHLKKIEVVSIPGASSVHSALSISGLPSDAYFFQGFLPKKKGRKTKFDFLKSLECSIIIFESPKRLKKTLSDIYINMGNRVISICKEISKIYETVYLDKAKNLIEFFSEVNPKGEYVIVISKEGYKLK